MSHAGEITRHGSEKQPLRIRAKATAAKRFNDRLLAEWNVSLGRRYKYGSPPRSPKEAKKVAEQGSALESQSLRPRRGNGVVIIC